MDMLKLVLGPRLVIANLPGQDTVGTAAFVISNSAFALSLLHAER